MQHSTQPVILQTAAPAMPPEAGLVDQYGLQAVLVVMVIKEALGWWRGKESAEDQLVATLVSDLRAANADLLNKFFDIQKQQHQDQVELQSRLQGLCDRLDKIL